MLIQMPAPELHSCIKLDEEYIDPDSPTLSIKFVQPGSFILQRKWSLGVKEWTLFVKSTEEENMEEENEEVNKLPGGLEQTEEQLQMIRDEENHALVLGMKREWDGWLHILPFPPALDQFEPGFFVATSAACNPGVLKGIGFDELSSLPTLHSKYPRGEDRFSENDFDFVSAPKVY